MFLKKIKNQFNQISFRLAFTYLSFFIPCYLITFAIFYVWTADFLKNRDRDIIDARMNQYQEIVEKEGVGGLRRIYEDSKMRTGAARYVLELSDLSGDILFFHMSEDMTLDQAKVLQRPKEFKSLPHESWFYILPNTHDGASIEMKTHILSNDLRLSIGASTGARDELLNKFQTMFLTILIPLLLSSIILSIYIAKKFLKPVDNLSHLIQRIKSGELSVRADLPEVRDELFHLTVAFNEMLNQVEFLINAMKDTLDNVAHDLRTPLARARIASELALKSGSPEKMKLAAEESIENLDVILNMIQTIMTLSGLHSKTLALNKEVFSARVVLDEIVDLYLFVAEEKNILIEIRCDDELKVFADRFMIRQALANLLDNAIKYSPKHTKIYLDVSADENEVVFQVIDQGMGISNEDLPRIWERLFRGDKSRNEKGFGLGLSLVKIFIESNGGKIEVKSSLNKGSIFQINLPTKL